MLKNCLTLVEIIKGKVSSSRRALWICGMQLRRSRNLLSKEIFSYLTLIKGTKKWRIWAIMVVWTLQMGTRRRNSTSIPHLKRPKNFKKSTRINIKAMGSGKVKDNNVCKNCNSSSRARNFPNWLSLTQTSLNSISQSKRRRRRSLIIPFWKTQIKIKRLRDPSL